MKKSFFLLTLIFIFSLTGCGWDFSANPTSTIFESSTTIDTDSLINIEEAKNRIGSIVRIKGIITDFYNNDLIIEDDTGTVLIRYTASSYKIGDLIETKGTISTLKGAIRLSNLLEMKKISSGNELPKEKNITSVDYRTLKEMLYYHVSIENLVFNKYVEMENMSAFGQFSLGESKVDIVISAYLDIQTKDALKTKMKEAIPLSTASIKGAYVFCEDNEYRLYLPNQTSLTINSFVNPLGSSFEASMITVGSELYQSQLNKITMPSIGNVKTLVVPVEFSDARVSFLTDILSDLNRVFYGNTGDTGWESVASYYQKSSYEKLNILGNVSEVISVGSSKTFMNTQIVNGISSSVFDFDILLKTIMQKLETKIDLTEYDSNQDGYIDSIYFIYNKDVYARDVQGNLKKNGSLYVCSDINNFWAWSSFYSNNTLFNGMKLSCYMWAGIDFMYYDDYLKNNYQNDPVLRNTDVYIHETGHLLGVDDYYDYDTSVGINLGIGKDDMMESNYGDHNAFTKILLGWITPKIVTYGSHEFTLSKFSSSGDCIIISPYWTNQTNIQSEFFIIDFYAYDGLDGDCFLRDCHSYTNQNNEQVMEGFLSNGIRIYYVNAQTDEKNTGIYFETPFSNDNSDSDFSLITLVSALKASVGTNEFLANNESAAEEDLFMEGQSYQPSNQAEGFNSKNWNFKLEVEEIGDEAKIKISFND